MLSISGSGLDDPGGNPWWPSAITETQRPSTVTVMQPEAGHENATSDVVPGKPTQDDLSIKVKPANIAMGTISIWGRTRRQEVREPQSAGDENEDDSIKYRSRLIHCTRCNEPKETRWMQLRQRAGYRDIHCSACRKHERCSHNKCQCYLIWHQCKNHRVDPPLHASWKAPDNKKKA